MTRTAMLLLLIPFCMPRGSLAGQALDPALLTKPATDSWPTYAGDYSQRRYSTLTQIDTTNVRHLSLAWVSRLTPGAGGEGGFLGPAALAAVTGGAAGDPVSLARWARATIWTRRDFCSHSIRGPGNCSGSSTPCR